MAEEKTIEELEDIEEREILTPRTQEQSLSDQFKESMTFFLPQIIGGIGGAVLGGGEAALGGMEAATKLTKSFRDAKKDQYRLENQRLQELKSNTFKPKAFQQTDMFNKDNGNPLLYNPNNATFIESGSKEVVDGSNVGIGVQTRSEANLAERGASREQKQAKMRFDAFSKFESVSRKEVEGINTIDPVINLIESGQPVTEQFLAPFIARGIQNEVGNLSDTDLNNAKIPKNLWNRVRTRTTEFFTGDATPEQKRAIVKVLRFMVNQKKSIVRRKARTRSSSFRAGGLQIEKDVLEKELLNETGLDFSEKKVAAKGKIVTRKSDGKRYRQNLVTGKYSLIED